MYSETEADKFFEEQIHIVDDELRKLEQRQAEFKESQEVLSPEAQREILLSRLADYEKSLTAVRTNRIGKESKLNIVENQMKNGQEISIPETETSDSPSREKYIAKLKGELMDSEIQVGQLLQKFTPEYEEVVNLQKQIEARKEMINISI